MSAAFVFDSEALRPIFDEARLLLDRIRSQEVASGGGSPLVEFAVALGMMAGQDLPLDLTTDVVMHRLGVLVTSGFIHGRESVDPRISRDVGHA